MGVLCYPLLSYPSTLTSTWFGGSKHVCQNHPFAFRSTLTTNTACSKKQRKISGFWISWNGFEPTSSYPSLLQSHLGEEKSFSNHFGRIPGFQDSAIGWIPWVSHHLGTQMALPDPPTPLQQILTVSLVSLCLLLVRGGSVRVSLIQGWYFDMGSWRRG